MALWRLVDKAGAVVLRPFLPVSRQFGSLPVEDQFVFLDCVRANDTARFCQGSPIRREDPLFTSDCHMAHAVAAHSEDYQCGPLEASGRPMLLTVRASVLLSAVGALGPIEGKGSRKPASSGTTFAIYSQFRALLHGGFRVGPVRVSRFLFPGASKVRPLLGVDRHKGKQCQSQKRPPSASHEKPHQLRHHAAVVGSCLSKLSGAVLH